MTEVIWVKCSLCGSPAERGAFRDYCSKRECAFQDSETIKKHIANQRVDDDATQRTYIPPSILRHKFSVGDVLTFDNDINKFGRYRVTRVDMERDLYEMTSISGTTFLRWYRDIAESVFVKASEEMVEFGIIELEDTTSDTVAQSYSRWADDDGWNLLDAAIKHAEKY